MILVLNFNISYNKLKTCSVCEFNFFTHSDPVLFRPSHFGTVSHPRESRHSYSDIIIQFE